MHARLAMILSIGGVLVAGTAAALVNSEVLRQSASPPVTAPNPSSSTTASIATSSTAPTSTAGLATTTSAVATTTVARPTLPPTPAPTTVAAGSGSTVPGSPTQQTFRLGDAATAVLDTANGELTIVSVVPHPGWETDRAEQEDSTSVEIRMRSASGEVRFEASLVRGVVVVSLRTDGDDADDSGSGSGEDDSGGGEEDNSGSGGGGGDNSGRGSDDD